MVDFLAERLTAAERRGAIVVFDAADAPPGLPDRYDHEGIDLRFARGYPDADAMIEALLEGVHRARGLTVVSGDRRVQRAARSSGAKWVDSKPWFDELCRRRPAEPDRPSKANAGSVGSTAEWVAEFSDPEALAEIERQAQDAPPPLPPPRTNPAATRSANEATDRPPRAKKKRRPPISDGGDKPRGDFGAGVYDPFPPGYADDLLDPPPSSKTDGADGSGPSQR